MTSYIGFHQKVTRSRKDGGCNLDSLKIAALYPGNGPFFTHTTSFQQSRRHCPNSRHRQPNRYRLSFCLSNVGFRALREKSCRRFLDQRKKKK